MDTDSTPVRVALALVGLVILGVVAVVLGPPDPFTQLRLAGIVVAFGLVIGTLAVLAAPHLPLPDDD